MIEGQSVLGLIAARGGSKGIPGKNIREIAGKPLITYTIEAGLASQCIDRLVLSSDDDDIIAAARGAGCEAPFKRAARLAEDDTPSIDVVIDALEHCPGYDWIVLLQPTSPLRTATDIDAAIHHCVGLGAPVCISVCEAEQSPYWMRTIDEHGRLLPLIDDAGITRRQDLPPVYIQNGAVYAARVPWLLRHRNFSSSEAVAYVMPVNRSLDIDTESDMQQLRILLEGRQYV